VGIQWRFFYVTDVMLLIYLQKSYRVLDNVVFPFNRHWRQTLNVYFVPM